MYKLFNIIVLLFIVSGCSKKNLSSPSMYTTSRDYYSSIVLKEAYKMDVDPNIVLGIIEKESSFRVNAYNRGSGAVGLMQLTPIAVKDVYINLYKIDDNPPRMNYFFNPTQNIKMGIKYLYLLNNFYYQNINNSKTKLVLILASYNAGPSRVYRIFGKNKKAAIREINRLKFKVFIRKLYKNLPKETKDYVINISILLN